MSFMDAMANVMGDEAPMFGKKKGFPKPKAKGKSAPKGKAKPKGKGKPAPKGKGKKPFPPKKGK